MLSAFGTSRRRARWGTPLLALTALVAGALVGGATPAAADDCDEKIIVEGNDGPRYVCRGGEDGQDGGGGDGGGGSGGGPSCDLSLAGGLGDAQWCEGEAACWANIPSAVYPEPEDWPDDQPSEDAVYVFKNCTTPDGETYHDWYWYTPDEPTIEELAWEAFGQLRLPEFTLAHNPAEKALVFLETWWWADGPNDAPVRGSSAAGLVAVAEPQRLELDPGDGSGTLNCPWSTSKSDACAHTYQRASTDGDATTDEGEAAYPARARLVYDLHFEMNGQVLEHPQGLPETVDSGWQTTPVQVTEAQAIVE